MRADCKSARAIYSLTNNLDVFDDAVIFQLIGLQLFFCLAIGKVQDAINGFHNVFQSIAVSNELSRISVSYLDLYFLLLVDATFFLALYPRDD